MAELPLERYHCMQWIDFKRELRPEASRLLRVSELLKQKSDCAIKSSSRAVIGLSNAFSPVAV